MAASVGMDIATDVVVAEVHGRMVAIGEVERVLRDGIAVYHTWGNVHPEYRRRGLGRVLLDVNIRRAEERAGLEPADQPVELGAFVDEGETGPSALMAEFGFEPIRWFFLMRRDLTEPIPTMDLPAGLELRPVLPEHHRAVFDAEVEAFRDHWGSREKTDNDFELTHKTEELDTSLWVVAWDGDEIAGVVQNWIWPTENAQLGVERGWLEHISVRRPWRRRGLARAITAESLRDPARPRHDRRHARRRRGQPERCARAVRGSRVRGGQAVRGVPTGAAPRDRSRRSGEQATTVADELEPRPLATDRRRGAVSRLDAHAVLEAGRVARATRPSPPRRRREGPPGPSLRRTACRR